MIPNGNCGRCGEKLKLLYSSWYCDCEDEVLYGFCVINTDMLLEMSSNVIEKGTLLFLFKDREEAKDIVEAFMGFSVIKVNLTSEKEIIWSNRGAYEAHKASDNLHYEMVR